MKLVESDDMILYKKCEEISLKDGLRLAGNMGAFCEKLRKKGIKPIGLAANQVGENAQVFIMWNGKFWEPFINPQIIEWSEDKLPAVEYCLSFPGKMVETFRYSWVKITCNNELDSCRPIKIYNLLEHGWLKTVCVQHEIAHLFGKTMMDFTKIEADAPNKW